VSPGCAWLFPVVGADRRRAPERWTNETPTAVANADAIAAVPGVDSLLIGPHDLAMELGIPGGFADERIVAAHQKVCDACRAHGKFAAAGFVTGETLLRRYISMGVRLILPGSDLNMMVRAATETAMRTYL
jgi:4-hydroxy-2-oxoheptanedioate aldolase